LIHSGQPDVCFVGGYFVTFSPHFLLGGLDAVATAGGTTALLGNRALNLTTFIVVSFIKTVLALFVFRTAVA
jgi:hypothetical protein